MLVNILTYNIHGMPWANTDMKNLFTWVFETSTADIVCFQELWSTKHRVLLQEFCRIYGWNVSFPMDSCSLGYFLKGLECGSGLAVAYKSMFELISTPQFIKYEEAAGVDKLITKGFYHLKFKHKNTIVSLLNTHFQSDFTELPCCRINYRFSRLAQEFALYSYAKRLQEPVLICGDLNEETTKFLHFLERNKHITFTDTGEHLDHICTLRGETRFQLEKSTYFDTIQYSDHIPVLFTINMRT